MKQPETNSPEYRAQHTAVWKIRGRPDKYDCVNCVNCHNNAAQWTWIHDTDPDNIYNYDPKCVSCHRKYDMDYDPSWHSNSQLAREFGNEGEHNGQAKLKQEQVDEIRKLWSTGIYKQKEIAEMFDIVQSHVSNIINNRKWTT